MNRLTIGPEGFVDLRRNPPADKDQVNGWTPENGQPDPVKETVPVQFDPPPVQAMPAIQKTAEGLDLPQPPVRVPKEDKPSHLRRIQAVNDVNCYAIVTAEQFKKLAKFEWIGTRGGYLYRREGEKIIWLHRAACNCRADRFVAFRNGDQRLCTTGPHGNLIVVAKKEKAKAMKMAARRMSAGK